MSPSLIYGLSINKMDCSRTKTTRTDKIKWTQAKSEKKDFDNLIYRDGNEFNYQPSQLAFLGEEEAALLMAENLSRRLVKRPDKMVGIFVWRAVRLLRTA